MITLLSIKEKTIKVFNNGLSEKYISENDLIKKCDDKKEVLALLAYLKDNKITFNGDIIASVISGMLAIELVRALSGELGSYRIYFMKSVVDIKFGEEDIFKNHKNVL